MRRFLTTLPNLLSTSVTSAGNLQPAANIHLARSVGGAGGPLNQAFGSKSSKGSGSTTTINDNQKSKAGKKNKQDTANKSSGSGKSKDGFFQDSKMSTSSSSSKRYNTRSSQSAGVKHDKNSMKFIMDLGDNKVARIDYRRLGPNQIELYHTEVPSELRGRGLGKALAKGALDSASDSKMKVKVTCSYLVDYIKNHSDQKYKRILDEN